MRLALRLSAGLAVIATIASVQARSLELTTFADLRAAFDAGNPVFVMADLAECAPKLTPLLHGAHGGQQVSSYRTTPEGLLEFSGTFPTLSDDGHPLEQVIRYHVMPEGEVQLLSALFDRPSMHPRGPTRRFRCALGQGFHAHIDPR